MKLLPLVLPAYRRYYTDLPEKAEDVLAMSDVPYEASVEGLAYAQRRDALVAELQAFCSSQGLDAMIWPTLGHQAPQAADEWPSRQTPLSFVNRLGLPEVSTPVGLDPDGIPLGNISFVGMPFTDFDLLALAHVFEQMPYEESCLPA